MSEADYEAAGRIAAKALHHGKERIVAGARVVDILDAVEAYIQEQGASMAFPAQLSINEVAAHFCPAEDDETTLQQEDVVKLDVGVHVNGSIGDNALTVYLGADERKHALVEASRAARDAAIAVIKEGITPHEIGMIIETEITKRGFRPVRNLSGHGVGPYRVHTPPSIPNCPNDDHTPLVEGQVVAIEPFATMGQGMIHSHGEPTLFALEGSKPIRSAVKDVIDRIKSYRGLPFTLRWLTREFGPKTRLALLTLRRAQMLHDYPPLPEVTGALVSQSEHTIRVTKEGCDILTKP